MIRVSIVSYDMSVAPDENHCNPEEDYNVADCVVESIKTDLLEKMGCIPPWLSPNNQVCNFSISFLI